MKQNKHNQITTNLNPSTSVLEVLYWQSPYCRSCGCLMLRTTGKKQYDNSVSIEHIYPQSDLRRHTTNGSRFQTLLCHKCNTTKGTYDSPDQMQVRYEKQHPCFDIRKMLQTHRSFTNWLKMLRYRQNQFIKYGEYPDIKLIHKNLYKYRGNSVYGII